MTGTLSDESSPPSSFWRGRRFFIAGLGIGQIVSWGTLYYAFPLIAQPLSEELGFSRSATYLAITIALLFASLAAYPVGAAVDRGRGRGVMAFGSLAAGLLLIGWAQVDSLLSFYLLFAAIGLVQAMTLYDAAFAVTARRYGTKARDGITALTLWGGFASTVFIPVTQALLDRFDWRETLVVLGFCNLFFCIGLHLFVIDPRRDAWQAPHAGQATADDFAGRRAVRWALRQPVFWGLLLAFVANYGTFYGFSFHLYPLLLERGFPTEAVVVALAVVGPAQVAGRFLTWLLAARRPIRQVGLVNVLVFPLAFALLLFSGQSFVALLVFAVVYGAANGIITIVRGLSVHEMLTPRAYGAINGALAVPIMLAQAVAPLAAAWLWTLSGGYDAVLWACLGGSLLLVIGFWFAAFARVTPP